MVSVDETPWPEDLQDYDDKIVDLLFPVQDAEFRQLKYLDGIIYALAKDNKAGFWAMYKGDPVYLKWQQIGAPLPGTPTSFWTDGKTILVLLNSLEKVGMQCVTTSTSASTEQEWQSCTGFPDYIRDGPDDVYSTLGFLFGPTNSCAVWFEAKTQLDKWLTLHVQNNGQWPKVYEGQLPNPNCQVFFQDSIYLGYLGRQNLVVRYDNATGSLGDCNAGLEPPADEYSGVAAFCATSSDIYAFYFVYNAAESTVTVYRLKQGCGE